MRWYEKLFEKKNGFAIGDLGSFALLFGVAAITMGLVATILVQIQGTQTSGSTAYNVTGLGITGVASLAGWIPTFVVIVAAVLVLGMLGLLAYRKSM